MDYHDKTVLVTGGARGIGLACARRFAAAGARVVIADLLDAPDDPAFAAGYVQCDAGDAGAVAALVRTVLDRFGGIDVCVCAAGISGSSLPYWDLAAGQFDRVLAVNLKGPFELGKLVGKHMADTGRRGAIVHVSSVGGRLAVELQAAYCISKAGLDMLTKVMSIALAPHGIRVNGVGPGPVDTAMTAGLASHPDMLEKVMARTPLGRLGSVDEIAGTVYFLAGEDAGFITGQTIYADGGRTVLNYVMKGP
jgi:NAD(P)-dependent dehydrogenase (short-subunit alcohol dehydrogenase family)